MHILASILMFIILAILAAGKGDYSGIATIGKFIGYAVLIFAMLWLFTQPLLLIVVIIVVILIVLCCSVK